MGGRIGPVHRSPGSFGLPVITSDKISYVKLLGLAGWSGPPPATLLPAASPLRRERTVSRGSLLRVPPPAPSGAGIAWRAP
jgi:hypothetical protein